MHGSDRSGEARLCLDGAGRMLAEADEREMAKRRHGATFEKIYPPGARDPVRVTLPRNLRPPSKLARRRRDQVLDGAAWPGLGSHAAQEDDLSARLEHAREFVERGFRVGNG